MIRIFAKSARPDTVLTSMSLSLFRRLLIVFAVHVHVALTRLKINKLLMVAIYSQSIVNAGIQFEMQVVDFVVTWLK